MTSFGRWGSRLTRPKKDILFLFSETLQKRMILWLLRQKADSIHVK